MSYKQRTYVCVDCGAETTRLRPSVKVRVCFDCGEKRAIQAAREMAAKSGPAWEAFKQNPGAVTIRHP